MKQIALMLALIAVGSCLAQEFVPADSVVQNQLRYRLDLARYYFDKQEYQWVITALRDSLLEGVQNDSIAYYRGLAYGKMGKWERAVETLSEIFVQSENDSIKTLIKQSFCQYVQQLDPATAIEKLTELLQAEQHLDPDLMQTIGRIYEQNQLYAEANDVYETLLRDSVKIDTSEVILKLIENDKMRADYSAMLRHLRKLDAVADSTLQAEIAFLSASAYLHLNRYEEALELLLPLYQYTPPSLSRFAVIVALAHTYGNMGEKVLSWYLLEEAASVGNSRDAFLIQDQILQLRQSIASDSLAPGQFRHFRLTLPPEQSNQINASSPKKE